ncbi:hypothetical protein ACP70R_003791 [Stipagrostis hirtigluma subsp. patula]
MAGDDDRLSALGDDLLRRILYYAPAREAASTSVLSRRWGSLWRSTGAVNLAVRVHDDRSHFSYSDPRREEAEEAFFSRRDAFVLAAKAALAAAAAAGDDARVTRLTLCVEADRDEEVNMFIHGDRDWRRADRDVVGAVFSHPAASRVEELRVAAVDTFRDLFPDEVRGYIGIYRLASLPWETLRVLDLTNCFELAPPPAAAASLRLASLRLRRCSVRLRDLQALMDGAPELAAVHLESVFFVMAPPASDDITTTSAEPTVVHLRCRSATALVLTLCGQGEEYGQEHGDGNWAIEIDAPRLRSFRYKGVLRRFVLRRSSAPETMAVERVNLHFLKERRSYHEHLDKQQRRDEDDVARLLFWQFVHNFTSAKTLKLNVTNLNFIAVKGEARRAELLCVLHNVERLELEAVHDPTGKIAAVAIANLLRCCPIVHDLRLKLTTVPFDSFKDSTYGREFLEWKDRSGYDKSVNCFMDHRSKRTIAIPMDDDNGDRYDEVSDIRGLSGRSFTCLQSSLRRVALQFRLVKSDNCFGVRLIKFFAENAMVLKEICVDSGNRRLCEHMNLNVEKWISPTKACLKCKNLTEGLWEFSRIPTGSLHSATDLGQSTTGFTILPLRR